MSDSNPIIEPTIIQCQTLEELAFHGEPWNRLALRAPEGIPMLSHAWLASYFEHRLEPGESWRCFLAFRDERLVGVLPLVVTPHRVFGQHRPVLRAPRDDHTVSVDCLAEPSGAAETVSALLRAALEAFPRCLRLELRRLPRSSPTFVPIETARGIRNFQANGAFLDTRGDFEEYRKNLRKKFKANLRRRRKHLEQMGLQTRWLEKAEASESQLSSFMRIEASGWKGRAGTAIQNSPRLVAFYTSLIGRLFRLGCLVWHFMEVEGNVVAGNLVFRWGPALVLWKLGYDERYSIHSPGHILFEEMAKIAFARSDIDRIELIMDPDWHTMWKMKLRPFDTLLLYPRRFIPTVAGYLPVRAALRLGENALLKRAFRAARHNLSTEGRNR